MPGSANAASKAEWRAKLMAARRALTPELHDAEATLLAQAAVRDLKPRPGDIICAYLPVSAEPGSPQLLDRLTAAGATVILPVVVPGEPLDWARYEGARSLRRGPLGTAEPVGPRLGSAAVRQAGTVLVPALAVDRSGNRLGRGGGYYDRTLALLPAGARAIAVVRDAEIVQRLPAEPHDRPVTAALTPNGGVVPLRPG